MSDTSPFSVLLPVYHGDRPEYLRRAFDSVTREQDLVPDEVVIVRDGPVSAGMEELLTTLVNDEATAVRLVASEVNQGLARALEIGLAECRHEIVARMDADDICAPERFARQIPVMDSGFDIVGSAIREFETEGDDGIVRTPPLTPHRIASSARFHSPFNHPSVVYRRSAVGAAGGYQDLPLMEDYWLFVRMIDGGARVCNIADPLLCYRVGAGAYSRRGGWRLFRSELILQWRMRRIAFTSWMQFVRNMAVRGGYRLVPEDLRRALYRRLLMNRGGERG